MVKMVNNEDPQEIMKALESDNMIIHSDEMRTFSCWGSVEVKDKQGDIIPIEEIMKVMDIWMDRGAPLTFNHTNRIVGKGLNYAFAEKSGVPGVVIKGVLFKHYAEDDSLWNDIKEGKIGGLSFGGKSYSKERTENGNILRDLIGYEFAIATSPANQEAKFIDLNMIAKNMEVKKEDEEKPIVTPDNAVTDEPASNVENKPTEEPQPQSPVEDLQQKVDASNQISALTNMISQLVEKLSSLELKVNQMTAGAPAPIEEPKPEVEEKTEEDESESDCKEGKDCTSTSEEEEMKKSDQLQKEVEELKKALADKTVVNVIKAERPSEGVQTTAPAKDEKLSELRKSIHDGKMDFATLGKEIRKVRDNQ